MKIVTALIVLIALAPTFLAQQKKVTAIKFLEISDDDDEIFISGMRELMRKLTSGPQDTTGFVAIAQNASQRQKMVKEMLRQRPSLKHRIGYTRVGWRYDKSWENTEFWLIPKGADEPYAAIIADVSCPSIEVLGPEGLDNKKHLTFTANVSGGSQDEPITYHWSVTGGEIIKGQGSPSVQVEVRDSKVTSVTAKLTIGGIDEEGFCQTTAELTKKVIL